MRSSIVRRRALPIAAASLLSIIALGCFFRGAPAHGQEAPKPQNALPAVQINQSAKVPSKKAIAVEPIATEAHNTSVSDPSTALGTYNPALDLRGIELPPGTTITTAGPVDGYRALSAMSATKTATSVGELPQSIQVIPRSIIDDQRTLSVTEALRNASNVQGVNDLNIGNVDQQPLTLRGFGAEQWLDGLVVTYNAGDRDAFANVERIEVLKGPNAILYGGGPGAPVGGAVNVISKMPTNRPFSEVGVTFGSEAYVRPYFDINQPLAKDGTVLFRVTGEYTGSDSYIDVLQQDRYNFNPTLTFTDKTDNTLTIQGRFSRFEQQGYQGLPAVGTISGDFRIDPHLYIGPSDITPSTSEVRSVTATFDHRFDAIWSGNVKARYSASNYDQNTQTTVGAEPDIPPSSWAIINSEVKFAQEEFTINPNLQGRFNWGATSNTLLFGADYSRVTDVGHHFTDNLGNYCYFILGACAPPTTVDLLNPNFPIPYIDPLPANAGAEFTTYGDVNNLYSTKGAYTQLQTSIFDRVHLMAGVRLANLQIDYRDDAPVLNGFGSALRFKTDATKLLPRAGAVIDLFDGVSVYGSYSQGMRWAGFGVQSNPANTAPPPEESEQFETGLKIAFAPGLSGTISFFHIDRTGVPATANFFTAIPTDQTSQGAEADLIWQPDRNWRVLTSYGYVDAEFATSSDAGAAGARLPGVPAHSGRLWANYRFDPGPLGGWSVGAGIYAASDQFVDGGNVYKAPAYFTVDAKIGYDTETFSAALNIKNLTDEDYFVPYTWFGGQVAPGAPRAFYGTIAYKY